MKRIKRFELRLTEEADTLLKFEKQLGVSRTELIRLRVLQNTNTVLINAKGLLKILDTLGEEMGRCGNNINQLSRHANVLNKQGLLTESVVRDFNELFGKYIKSQQDIEKVLRQLIRLMKGRAYDLRS